jgi:hypothetical protein
MRILQYGALLGIVFLSACSAAPASHAVPGADAGTGAKAAPDSETADADTGTGTDAGTDPETDAAPDADTESSSPDGGHYNCGAIEVLPPNVTVLNATTGAPICDATFTVVGWDAGAVPDTGAALCDGTFAGCPAAPSDGGTAPCSFALLGLDGADQHATFDVQVSETGFAPTVVPVKLGFGGCAPYTAASQVTVSLTPQ